MSSRDSRSHNDSRANRLPYHPEPRQGRFGRVENWREAEERRQEEIRRQRRAHSRSANTGAQQPVGGQSGAQQRVPQSQSGVQHDAEQEALQRRAAARHEERKRHAEVNPWQQGRFGRVENWGDVERRRRQQEQEQAQAQAQQQSERPVRKTPTQQHAEELERQRAQRKAQAKGAVPAKDVTGSQSRAGETASSQREQGAGGSAQASGQDAPSRSSQESAHVSGSYRQPNRGALSRAKAHLSRPQALHSATQPRAQQAPVQSQARQAAVQQSTPAQAQQRVRQQQSRTEAEQPFVPTDKVSNYSRDSYTSHGGKSTASPAAARPARTSSNRRASASKRSGMASKVPQIPKKIIVIAAAVFALVIILGVAFSCSQSRDDEGGFMGAGGGTQAQASLPTPIMSESSGVIMHSAVAMEDLTEILIHNASYAYANEITTRLAEATNTDVINAHGTGRIASTQPTGDNWMTGEFIRCFRSGNAGPIMSAIDCGGPVGATVYAPVTGEVVMVKEYMLYNEIDDFRVHIQPTGRPDLDVVLIHLTDVTVKPGDKVTAGVTPIAQIRDIYQYLDESLQLKNYTAEGDNGNHTHIQVNNANHPEYTALDELKPQPEPAPAPDPATPNAATPAQ